MSSGTYTPSSSCIATGMPLPVLSTLILLRAWSISTASRSMARSSVSRVLWSQAFTRTSSKILYRPGTYDRVRLAIRGRPAASGVPSTKVSTSECSTEPT